MGELVTLLAHHFEVNIGKYKKANKLSIKKVPHRTWLFATRVDFFFYGEDQQIRESRLCCKKKGMVDITVSENWYKASLELVKSSPRAKWCATRNASEEGKAKGPCKELALVKPLKEEGASTSASVEEYIYIYASSIPL